MIEQLLPPVEAPGVPLPAVSNGTLVLAVLWLVTEVRRLAKRVDALDDPPKARRRD